MAGAGFKTFGVGDVLTASDVNTYLMQQAVMNFASSGARGSAIGTATEGMVTYLQDTDSVEVYDGSGWSAIGAAGIGTNVVQTVKTDTYTTTSGSFVDVTGLTVTITPSSATSKILVIADVKISGGSGNSVHLRLNGGGSAVDYVGDTAGSRVRSAFSGANWAVSAGMLAPTLVYLDSPASTSAQTYAVQVRRQTGTVHVNRSGVDTDSSDYGRTASSITAIEVAA